MSVAEAFWGVLAAGGGGAGVAFLIFRFAGAGWLEEKFAEKLEAFRHDKAKELERLRAEISGSLDVTIRSQEKEFFAITECWRLINEAYGLAITYTNPIQTFTNLTRMCREMQEEYISSFDFMESQKNEILAAEDPDKEFAELVTASRFRAAKVAIIELNNEIHRNEIFLDQEIFDSMFEIKEQIHKSIVNYNISTSSNNFSAMSEPHKKLADECRELILLLGTKLRQKVKRVV